MRRVFPLALILLLGGCVRPSTVEQDLVIAAAADLRYAMDDIARQFQQDHLEIKVKTTYGSSGQFAAQIASGAPYDVFCSADMTYPHDLTSRGYALPDSEFQYAIGRLVIWVPKASPIPIEQLGIQALRHPSIRHITIANPGHAPYGKAAVAAMTSLGVYDVIKYKLAYGENVSQALQYIQLGSAEIGVVALSLAVAPTVRDTGRYWEIPTTSYPRMEQGCVILKATKHEALARQFRVFLLADHGREILKSYGFFLPKVFKLTTHTHN